MIGIIIVRILEALITVTMILLIKDIYELNKVVHTEENI